MTVALVLGLAIGVVMGLTGAGGGVLAVPALVFALGLTMPQAAPIAMVGVSLAAAVGTLEGLRHGTVRYRAALFIALLGWPFSALGIALAHSMHDLTLRIVFVLMLAFVAWRQLHQTAQAARVEAQLSAVPASAVAELNPATGRFIWNRRAFGSFSCIGAITGGLSGLLGVSGGFVLVPMLSRFTRLDAPSLVGTSLMVGSLVTGFGALAAVLQGVAIPWPITGRFAAALVGGLLAARLVSHRLPLGVTRGTFAALVIAVAVAMAIDVARRLIGG
ncbi:MAG TPA: sulfite exporter TauE/SafE family protein [Burkholderiaceae bacterium]